MEEHHIRYVEVKKTTQKSDEVIVEIESPNTKDSTTPSQTLKHCHKKCGNRVLSLDCHLLTFKEGCFHPPEKVKNERRG